MTLKTIDTTCAYCGVGCGIQATVDNRDRSVLISGLTTHPANRGKLCSKGSTLGDTVGLQERLLSPEVNGKPVDWDTALDTVSDQFQRIIDEHGPDAVALYLSGQLLTEDYYVANKLMKGFIGSANIDTNSRLCMSSAVAGHKRAFGTDTVPGCYEDFEHAELIVLIGSNTIWCHPVLYQRILAHKTANPQVKVVVIDPRRTQTCDIADLHLPIAPGADSWLFNGLLAHLADQDQLDHSYINHYCNGFDEALKNAQLSSPTIAQTAEHCGLNETDVNTFFEWFGATEKTVSLYSQGINQSSSGTDKVNAIINCHLATGRIGRIGMGPFSMTGQPNAMGGREVGGLANTLAAHMDFNDDNVSRLQRFWHANTNSSSADRPAIMANKPGLTAVDLFDAIDQGKIKAVWIMATNPLVSLPNADKVKAALAKCELVVVSDCIRNTDTMDAAHVKLPATGWSEKDGTVTNSERTISRQRGLFAPAGESRHDWWIISQVAQRMGYKQAFNYPCAADIFREHAALSGFENSATEKRRDFDISLLQAISNDDYDNLQPAQWPLNKENPQGKQRFFSHGDFFTDDRKARFISISPSLPANAPDQQFPLRLNTGRIRDQWHTMTRTGLAAQLNQHIKEPFIELNPQDAALREIQSGDLAWVNSRWGRMLGRVIVTANVREKDCFAPIHWTAQLSRAGRIGAVVNPVVDPVSFQPESKHTPVQISPFKAQWHGLLISRKPIAKQHWPTAQYLVQTKGNQHSSLILANDQLPSDPMQCLNQWREALSKGLADYDTATIEELSYQDPTAGHFRMALIAASGELLAVALFSRQQDLPDSAWLGSQFQRTELDRRSRSALLSGRAPAGEDIGRIICACFSVGEKTINKAIKTQQLDSVASIGQCLKAGTNCGSCVPELKALLG